jgi:DNA modification methylase
MDKILVHCAHSEIWPIEKITPNPRNPNQHPDKQIKLLAKIIKGHGWRAPITVSKRSGFVIRGHGRLAAALSLGLDEAPVDLQDYATDAEEYADMIADNRISELAEINQEELNSLVAELDGMKYDTGLLGFTDKQIKEMLAAQEKEGVHEDNFDAEAEAAAIAEPMVKPGEVWRLGDHTLMCGDSTLKADVNKALGGRMCDMIFTDPPYNVMYVGGHPEDAPREEIENDKMSNEEFYDFLFAVYSRLEEVAKPGAAFYVCFPTAQIVNFHTAASAAGLDVKQILIWVKQRFVMGRQDYQWNYEPILYGWKPGASHKFFGGRKLTTALPAECPASVETSSDGSSLIKIPCGLKTMILKVPSYEVVNDADINSLWFVDAPIKSEEHPTMKPVKLAAKAILNSSEKSDLVVDLFGGSGTTLIACEQTGRQCCTMELMPKYCDVIIRRWEKLTGNKAVLIS